jgi:hypothetical protein
LGRALLAALLLCLAMVPLAHADGDPASDYLIGQSTFIPPDANISNPDQAKLAAMLVDAKRKGYTLRVAVIASAYDLGSVTVLNHAPHLYAPFLSQELRFVYKGRVLVVMSNGLAIARDGKRDPAEQKVIANLVPPKPFQGPAVAALTQRAVRRLAANAGVHVTSAPISPKGGSSRTSDRLTIVAMVAVGLLVVAGFSLWRRRGASSRNPSP